MRCRACETICSATSRGRADGGNTNRASANAKAAPVTTHPCRAPCFADRPRQNPKPVSTCQAVATRTRPSSPARSTAISLSLRRLSRSRPTCRTTCGTAALVLRHVPQAAAVASKPQPAAYRVRVRAAGADRGLSRGPVVGNLMTGTLAGPADPVDQPRAGSQLRLLTQPDHPTPTVVFSAITTVTSTQTGNRRRQ
jgi:hypothetical protein